MRDFVPEYGLSGGDLRFDLGSLLLFSRDSNQHFRMLSTTPSDGDWNQQNADDRARVMHERDHLLRTLCTGIGILIMYFNPCYFSMQFNIWFY